MNHVTGLGDVTFTRRRMILTVIPHRDAEVMTPAIGARLAIGWTAVRFWAWLVGGQTDWTLRTGARLHVSRAGLHIIRTWSVGRGTVWPVVVVTNLLSGTAIRRHTPFILTEATAFEITVLFVTALGVGLTR